MLAWAALALASSAAHADATTGRIPNAITLPALLAGVVVGHPLGVLCAVPALWLFARGKMAGGDVKLLAAVGALLGLTSGLCVAALAVGLAVATRSRRLGPWVLVAVLALHLSTPLEPR